MIYRIRVEGRLGPEWGEVAGGMTVEVRGDRGRRTTSDLVGPLTDDAQLMGILDQLYTHGARLLKVDRIDEEDLPASAGERRHVIDEPTRGHCQE